MTDEMVTYKEGLANLSDLIDAGQGESLEAEQIRDRLDAAWAALTEEQRNEIRRIPIGS